MQKPRGLLLDFGGVVVQTQDSPTWMKQLASRVLLGLSDASIPTEGLTQLDIERDLAAGASADSRWKNAMSRPFAPRELGYAEFWGDFVGADWPCGPHAYVIENARELCQYMGELRQIRELRTGIDSVLSAAEIAEVPVAIVSNCLMGEVHRQFLDSVGMSSRFVAQIYSDEVGIRKPNPEMINLGARAIGVDVESCWYVGDNFDRDVLCGVRAKVGGNILMVAGGTYSKAYDLAVEPHAIVADPRGLLDLFASAIAGGAD